MWNNRAHCPQTGAAKIVRQQNIRHPTPNKLRGNASLGVGCWMLDVGCSVLNVFLLLGSGCAGLWTARATCVYSSRDALSATLRATPANRLRSFPNRR